MADEAFVPWERAERPTPTAFLRERLEGQTISRLHYLDAVGPTGSRGLGVELTTGAKLLIFAGRVRDSRYSARLYLRFLPIPTIILPRMTRAWSVGRDVTTEPPDDLQRCVEGCRIHGILTTRTPTSWGGEQLAFDLERGARWAIAAQPISHPYADGPMLADLVWQYAAPQRVVS